MTTFDDQSLFDKSLDTVRVGPLRVRQILKTGIAGHGSSVVPQGIEAREIDHAGRLVADSPADLRVRTEAIERYIDAGPQTLTLDDGHRLDDCVMTTAEFDPPIALGPRVACRFRVRYLQLTPGQGVTP